MIKINRYLSRTVLAVLVLVFFGTSSLLVAADEDARFKSIAEEMIGAGGISWSPKVNYYQLVLTIARPDGSVFSKTFEAGATPFVDLSGIFGESADDGAYTYELRLIPRVEQRVRSGNQDTIVARTQDRRHLPRRAVTQSGGFTVKHGMIVTDSMTEPEAGNAGLVISTGMSENGISRTMAQVFNTDLIVQGSACVGVDCSSGESFGFDTIRLKENNLRIKFQDTSASASFPSNDWQLTANDSNNGGANKFSIDDIDGGRTPFTIEASAPSHSLYVDDGGKVGFGTSTPVVDLHVKSGNTPTLRLEQDGSSGFTPQTWDVAGNETNFFVRDATNGSQLPFKIRPGADHNSLVIDTDNDIGIGLLSPSYPIHLKTSGKNAQFVLERDGGAAATFTGGNSGVNIGSITDHELRFVSGASQTTRMIIDVNGAVGIDNANPDGVSGALLVVGTNGTTYCDGTSWATSSSRELKENIKNLTPDEAIEALNELNPVRFNYKAKKDDDRVGFIAEDVPEIVATKTRKSLVSMDILAVVTKVVKEQQKTIAELKAKVAELEKKQQ